MVSFVLLLRASSGLFGSRPNLDGERLARQMELAPFALRLFLVDKPQPVSKPKQSRMPVGKKWKDEYREYICSFS